MSRFFPTREECGQHAIFPGVTIQTCAGNHLLLSHVSLEPYSVVEEHSHPHEQVGMVLEGKATFWIGDEEKVLEAGDLYVIPGNVRHRVVAHDQLVRALDIFHPVRHEYL